MQCCNPKTHHRLQFKDAPRTLLLPYLEPDARPTEAANSEKTWWSSSNSQRNNAIYVKANSPFIRVFEMRGCLPRDATVRSSLQVHTFLFYGKHVEGEQLKLVSSCSSWRNCGEFASLWRGVCGSGEEEGAQVLWKAAAMVTMAAFNLRKLVVVYALLCSTAFVAHGVGTKAVSSAPSPPPPNAIFVFGDSYLDTGNHNKSAAFNRPWLAPYGVTFPGAPAGRFSDGRVFADVFADALQMPSPIAYELRFTDPNAPKHGMNFAVGGSGAFSPYGMLSLRGQIDELERLVDVVYPKVFLQRSVVLVGVHGNDYGAYLAKGNPVSGIPALQRLVVDEMVSQLERLHKLGFQAFFVNNIQPIGCLPSSTRPEFRECIEVTDAVVSVGHNELLAAAIANLTARSPGAVFKILDHFTAFNTVLRDPANHGISTEDPLMPCCLGAGISTEEPLMPCCMGSCGEADGSGKPLFRVCADPAKSFFWDTNHPSQAGWIAVAKVLFPDAAELKPLSAIRPSKRQV